MRIQDNIVYIFVGMFLLAFTFNLIQKAETNTLLAMIVISGLAWVAYSFILQKDSELQESRGNTIAAVDGEAKLLVGKKAETYANNAQLPVFPKKGFKHLTTNTILLEIATALGVVRMFDRSRYADLCLLMNTYQKTYAYILGNRYEAGAYMPIFMDLGDAILENMYSLVFVVPTKLKHVYGLDTEKMISENIDRFTVLRGTMTAILESYAKKQLGIQVVPETLPKASDQPFSVKNSQRLP